MITTQSKQNDLLEKNKFAAKHYSLSGGEFVFNFFIDQDGMVNFLKNPSNSGENGWCMKIAAESFLAIAEKLKEQLSNVRIESRQ